MCVRKKGNLNRPMPLILLTRHLRPAGFRWRRLTVVGLLFCLLAHSTEMQHELALSRLLRREICPRVRKYDRWSHTVHTGTSTLASTRTASPSRHHPSLRNFLHTRASGPTRRTR